MLDLGKQVEIVPEVEAKFKKNTRVREGSKCEICELKLSTFPKKFI